MVHAYVSCGDQSLNKHIISSRGEEACFYFVWFYIVSSKLFFLLIIEKIPITNTGILFFGPKLVSRSSNFL